MLTVGEVAQRFRVTPRTIRNWIASGKLRAKRIGRPWVLSEEALTEATENSPRHEEETRRGES